MEACNEDQSQKDKDLEWENRRLCVDEACIGVIGPDGRCKECGKPEDPEAHPEPDAASTEAQEASALAFQTQSEPENEETDTSPDRYWENRRLCVDEACIGVIGPDGRCKECGKPEKGPAQ